MPINAKSYQFDARFWNKNVAQFTFNYFSINNWDIPQSEDTDLMLFSEQLMLFSEQSRGQ